MRRPALLLLAACLALPSCKTSQRVGGDPAQRGEDSKTTAPAARPIILPAPHPLAEDPRVGVRVDDPLAALLTLKNLIPGVPELPVLAETMLATQLPAELARAFAPLLADRRPWLGAELEGEDILHLPLRPGDLAAAEALLAALPPEGDFGAVRLPPAALHLRDPDLELTDGAQIPDQAPPQAQSRRSRLAWVDRQQRALRIASTLPGLATSRELERGYARGPLWLSVDGARIRESFADLVDNFPFARLLVRGAGLHELTLEIHAEPGRALPPLPELAPGAMGHLHGAAPLALAASARWSGHQDAVRGLIREMNANVDRAGFAARLVLDGLVQQASAVLRAWNGRVFVGLGPTPGHLALAFGADDPVRAGQGLSRLLGAIVDNLELARLFASNVPKLNLRRHSKDPEVHLLTVPGARGMLPAEARALLDDKGNLRLAFGFSARSGAVYAVLGPRAETELTTWAAAIAAAPADEPQTPDLIALTVALTAEQIAAQLAQNPSRAEQFLQQALALTPDRAPTQITARQDPDRYVITALSPAAAAPPRRQGRGR
ncbi:MAG: hypothetical protein IPK80_13380 [Nannocystis sp.]|nr:hypothetical protein [Nannocystis sp.]